MEELQKIKDQLNRIESKQNGEYARMEKKIDTHVEEDKNVYVEIREFHMRMEPVLKAFENKKIVRMAIENETKTWVFYVKSGSTLAIGAMALWAMIRFIFFSK